MLEEALGYFSWMMGGASFFMLVLLVLSFPGLFRFYYSGVSLKHTANGRLSIVYLAIVFASILVLAVVSIAMTVGGQEFAVEDRQFMCKQLGSAITLLIFLSVTCCLHFAEYLVMKSKK